MALFKEWRLSAEDNPGSVSPNASCVDRAAIRCLHLWASEQAGIANPVRASMVAGGPHISGPSASRYKDRVAQAPQFVGRTVSTNAQVNAALANPSLQIHHGALLTCVWRPETALCQDGTSADKPAWSRCRLTCQNIAYIMRATSACLA